jgi:nicotinamide riboside transporter PnuC
MILTVRRAIEQWILWIAVDAIEVFMWYKTYSEEGSLISILLMWLLFLANGIYLLSLWIRIEQKTKAQRNPEKP